MEFVKYTDKIEIYNSFQSITIGKTRDNRIYITSSYTKSDCVLTSDQLNDLIGFITTKEGE